MHDTDAPTRPYREREDTREVPDALEQLAKASENLLETAQEVANRLDMVLMPAPGDDGDTPMKGYGAPLAQGIGVQTARVETATDTLRSVLARLAL